MRQRIIAGIILSLTAATSTSLAETVAIDPADFSPDATVITFDETGTTELPEVPGVSFPYDIGRIVPLPLHYLAGVASSQYIGRPYDPAYGNAAYSNLVGGAVGYSDLAIVFDSPVEAIGGWVAACDDCVIHTIDFRVLDGDGHLLGSTLVPLSIHSDSDPLDLRFYGFTSSSGISRAEWRIVGDTKREGGFFVENLTFGNLQAVPIPAAVWLLGSALGVLGVVRRRADRLT